MPLERAAAQIAQLRSPDESIGEFAAENDLNRTIAEIREAESSACQQSGRRVPDQLSDPQRDPAYEQWLSLPEKSELKEACSNDLKYSNEIVSLKAGGANIAALLRWAEQESSALARLRQMTK